MVSCLFSLNKYFNFLASWYHKPCCKCSPTSLRTSLAYVHRGGTAGSMRWADLILLCEAGWWDQFISPPAIQEGSCFCFCFFTFSLWSNLVHLNYPPPPTGGWMQSHWLHLHFFNYEFGHLFIFFLFICISLSFIQCLFRSFSKLFFLLNYRLLLVCSGHVNFRYKKYLLVGYMSINSS